MSFSNEPILSRKIAIKSMTRHFAGWKIRYFTLDRTNQVLEVVTEGTKRTVIELRSASVSMGRHYYPLDDFHWFFIKYFDNAESCFKEVILKFEKLEDLERWDKVRRLARRCVCWCAHRSRRVSLRRRCKRSTWRTRATCRRAFRCCWTSSGA